MQSRSTTTNCHQVKFDEVELLAGSTNTLETVYFLPKRYDLPVGELAL